MVRDFVTLAIALLASGTLLGCAPPPPRVVGPGASEAARSNDAQRSYQLGMRLLGQKELGEALVAFERSNRLAPKPMTVFQIAECERLTHRPAVAYMNYERALEGRAELSPDVIRRAEAALVELTPLTARLDVTPSEPDAVVDAWVQRDEERRGEARGREGREEAGSVSDVGGRSQGDRA